MQPEDFEQQLARIGERQARSRERLVVAGLFAFAALLFLIPLVRKWTDIPGSFESRNAIWHVPVLIETFGAARLGLLPLWNPNISLGYPVGAVEGGILAHPLLWIAGWLQASSFLRLMILVHMVGSLAAFYHVAVRHGMRRTIAAFGSMLYAWNTFHIAHVYYGDHDVGFVAMVLPLVLHWAVEWCVRRRMMAGYLLMATLAAVALISGMTAWLHLSAAVLLLPLAASKMRLVQGSPVQMLSRGAAVSVPAMLAGAATALPRMEWFKLSQPDWYSTNPWSFPVSSIVSFFVPRFYGGGSDFAYWNGGEPNEVIFYTGVMFLLPFIAWPTLGERRRLVVRLAGFGLLGAFVLACAGSFFPLSWLARRMPTVMEVMKPARAMQIGVFCAAWAIAVAADNAVQKWQTVRARAVRVFAIAGGAYFLLLAVLLIKPLWKPIFATAYPGSQIHGVAAAGLRSELYDDWTYDTPEEMWSDLRKETRNAALQHCFQQVFITLLLAGICVALRTRREGAIVFTLLLVALLDLRLGSGSHQDTSNQNSVRLPRIVRDHLEDLPAARLAVPLSYNVRNAPVMFGRTTVIGDVPRPLTNITSAFALNPLLEPTAAKRVSPATYVAQLGYAGIDYLALPAFSNATIDGYPLKVVAADDNTTLAQVEGVLPRARLVNRIDQVSGREAAVARTVMQPFDGKTMAVAAEPIDFSLPVNPPPPQSSARLDRTHPTRLEWHLWSNTAGVCLLADTWYPGWKADVNHAARDVQELNVWMRGVAVPEGNSFVEMRFDPFSWRLGIFLSLLWLVGFVTAASARIFWILRK